MSKKRDRLKIAYDILKIIKDHNNSIKKTPLLRYTNISSQSFNNYYCELKNKSFIREVIDKKGQIYLSLTDKGFNYLTKYNQIKGFIEEFEL